MPRTRYTVRYPRLVTRTVTRTVAGPPRIAPSPPPPIRTNRISPPRTLPTLTEYHVALYSGDEETVLDYLTLCPTLDIHDPDAPWLRTQDGATLFDHVVIQNFVQVLEWLISDERQVKEALVQYFAPMLRRATSNARVHIIDSLLSSCVFEALSAEEQQISMRSALYATWDVATSNQLIAHGLDLTMCDWSLVFATPWNGVRITEHIPNANTGGLLRWALHHGFVDINALVQGKTLLMKCMEESHNSHLVHSLIDAGADTTIRDEQGRTALHIGLMHGSMDCVRVLLSLMNTEEVHRDRAAMDIAWHGVVYKLSPCVQVLTLLLDHGSCSAYYRELRKRLAWRLLKEPCQEPSVECTCACSVKRERIV